MSNEGDGGRDRTGEESGGRRPRDAPAEDQHRRGEGQRREGSGQGQGHRRQQQPQHGQPGQQGRGQRQQPQHGSGQGHQQGAPGQPGRRQQGGGIDFGSLPWVSGAIQGAAYFVVALISLAFVVFVDIMLISSGSSGGLGGGMGGGSGEALAYAFGWLFYGAHFVSVSAGAMGSMNLVDLVGLAGLPSFVYYLVPPIFLFLAGRSIARSTGHSGMPNEALAARGATAVAGYLPLAVLGSIALTRNGAGPSLSTTVLVMGLGYPLVFGALGGYLADR